MAIISPACVRCKNPGDLSRASGLMFDPWLDLTTENRERNPEDETHVADPEICPVDSDVHVDVEAEVEDARCRRRSVAIGSNGCWARGASGWSIWRMTSNCTGWWRSRCPMPDWSRSRKTPSSTCGKPRRSPVLTTPISSRVRRGQHRTVPLLRGLQVHRRTNALVQARLANVSPAARRQNWWPPSPRPCTTPTSRAWYTAMSSRAIS